MMGCVAVGDMLAHSQNSHMPVAQSPSRMKIAICAEYQGRGAVIDTVTGFMLSIEHLLAEASNDESVEVVLFCLGIETRVDVHPRFANITIRQYQPLVTPQELAPQLAPHVIPFRVELFPWRRQMIRDLVSECPDVIHTFQTVGATDIAGLLAAQQLRSVGHAVRLVSSITTEIETYTANFFSRYISDLVDYQEQHRPALWRMLQIRWRGTETMPTRSQWFHGFNAITYLTAYPALEVAVIRRHWNRPRNSQQNQANGNLSARRSNFWIAHILRRFTSWQIQWYLSRADVVTTVRVDDAVRYQVPEERCWQMPFCSNTPAFVPVDESIGCVRSRIDVAAQSGELSAQAVAALRRFLDLIEQEPECFAFVTIGRLSDDKNVWLMADAFRRLPTKFAQRKCLWLAFGTGVYAEELAREFGDRITLVGLVPNAWLAVIYNLFRSRRFVFVSAADTEVYGISHEESQRCGLPIIAMELGTRGHFYRPGDVIGRESVVPSSSQVVEFVCAVSSSAPLFQIATNGFSIPDLTNGRGLNAVRQSGSQAEILNNAAEALSDALLVMSQLPADLWSEMSRQAIEITGRTKFDWPGIWRLLRDGIYPGNRAVHTALIDERRHEFATSNSVK